MRYIIIFLLIYQAICGPVAYAAVAAGGGAWMAMPAVMAAYSTCQSACAAALLAPTL
jgi:hypothetical protein